MPSRKRRIATPFSIWIVLALLLSGCATAENDHDPLEGLNRGVYQFNEAVDTVLLEPVARGYIFVTPRPVRRSVSNFFDNIGYPNVILNDYLQGKFSQGTADLTRFVINSTFGIGGLFDLATPGGVPAHDEDFGQTLAVWGFGQGAYLVLPILGPNSYRELPDLATSTYTNGLYYLYLNARDEVVWPTVALSFIDRRARLIEAGELVDELALDPYIFTREAYRQRREYLIHDGNPPERGDEDDPWADDAFDDPWADESPAREEEPATERTTP